MEDPRVVVVTGAHPDSDAPSHSSPLFHECFKASCSAVPVHHGTGPATGHFNMCPTHFLRPIFISFDPFSIKCHSPYILRRKRKCGLTHRAHQDMAQRRRREWFPPPLRPRPPPGYFPSSARRRGLLRASSTATARGSGLSDVGSKLVEEGGSLRRRHTHYPTTTPILRRPASAP